jgi:hypothetical protein
VERGCVPATMGDSHTGRQSLQGFSSWNGNVVGFTCLSGYFLDRIQTQMHGIDWAPPLIVDDPT